MTSKSFRAVLPALSDVELTRLRRWSGHNCAESVLSREGGSVIWLATREKAKTKAGFMRSIRATLQQLSIDLTQVKGRWLLLTTKDLVSAETSCQTNAETSLSAEYAEIRSQDRSSTTTEGQAHSDERIIFLSNDPGRRGSREAMRVTKL